MREQFADLANPQGVEVKRAELQNTIQGIKTAVPVSIELVSKPTNMRITNNPYADAVKVVTLNGMIGMSYSNGVNNELSREGKPMDFESQSPVWMKRLGKNLGTNKAGDKVYLPIKVQTSWNPPLVSIVIYTILTAKRSIEYLLRHRKIWIQK